ncbi:MAG: sensor histidine kinase [Caldilineales bacterium]|nr:sensor histidine kinase [Caldilineales bacterium]
MTTPFRLHLLSAAATCADAGQRRAMRTTLTTTLRRLLPELGGYLVLVAVLVVSLLVELPPSERVVVIGLQVVLIGLTTAAHVRSWWSGPLWLRHLFMTARAAIIALLIWLAPSFGLYPVLFFVLSAEAPSLFGPRIWRLYIAGFAILTAALILFTTENSAFALALAVVYAGGYYFFAAFAANTAAAEAAQEELEAANRRLHDYAAQVEELTIMEERNRLAREMHDTLGHRLTVAAVQLEAAQRLIARDPERATAVVGTVREQVNEALAELRQTVAALRAPLEADLGLDQALQRLVTHFGQATGIAVALDLPADLPDLPASHRLAFFRAAQELLTNVQRHADARQAWVRLWQQDGLVFLRVEDNGAGLPTAAESSGFGLRGLRERAAQLSGGFELAPRPGGGVQATFSAPFGGGGEMRRQSTINNQQSTVNG